MSEHDVIVVGGGPAGLSLALHLVSLRPALKGRLVVLEKEQYPREKYCAGAIGARGEMALSRIGVEIDVPSAPVSGIAVRLPQGTLEARRGCIGRVVRRIEFDHALAQEAARRGVRIEQGARVSGVEASAEGVRVQTAQGELRGRVVVGADGVGSVVRRSMGLGSGHWRAQVLEVDTEPVASDPAEDLLYFDLEDAQFDGYFWDFPTIVGGKRMACRGVYRLIVPGKRASDENLEARLGARLAAAGLDLASCKKKRYAERGFAPHEPAALPRRLLIGEAAGIDPITGEGIAQALLYGEVAARYLLDRLDANELTFGDWPRALRGTTLGFDMRLRHFICGGYFGGARGFYEGAFVQITDGLPLGVDYFAGRKLSAARCARTVAAVGLSALRQGDFSLLAPPPWA